MASQNTLYYIHDPMCSWCYAFRQSLQEIQAALSASIRLKKIVGGLAQDSDIPMDQKTQEYVQKNWREIEKRVKNTHFNYAFWTKTTPIRSTYPACRAVLSAKQQGLEYEDQMIHAIQDGYYQQAQNPSLTSTLIEFAANLKLDLAKFKRDLASREIQQQLSDDIQFSQSIGARSFPSLILLRENQYHAISIDYNDSQHSIKFLQQD